MDDVLPGRVLTPGAPGAGNRLLIQDDGREDLRDGDSASRYSDVPVRAARVITAGN